MDRMEKDMKQKNSVQISTVNQIEKAMRQKVKEEIPLFKSMSVSQILTTTQGEQAIKSNPAMQEIRALFRDYCAVVKIQRELANDNKAELEKTSIDLIRSKLKLVQ